jgi:hypothetical protein
MRVSNQFVSSKLTCKVSAGKYKRDQDADTDPFFDFDDDHTFFEVDFYILPAFKEDGKVSQKSETDFLKT